MKKNGILKAIGICFLVAVVLSWIIPTGAWNGTEYVKDAVIPVGIVNIFRIPVVTMQSFVQYFIVLLCIGLFYGVLNKTEVYYGIVEKISNQWKGKEKALLIIITVFFALFSSLTGNSILLIALLPFVAAVLLKTGYDKKTALLATVGSLLVGRIASTFGFNGYGYYTNIIKVGITEEWLVRLILFLMLTGLYIFFIIKKSNVIKPEVEVKKRGRAAKPEVVEEKVAEPIPFLVENKKTKSAIPFVIISIIVLLISATFMYYWYYAIGTDFFSKIFTSITSFKIGEFQVFNFILDGFSTFGMWNNYDLSVVLVITSIIIAWLYGLKVKDYVEGAVNGIKEILPVAFVATICNVVFYIMVANQTEYLASIVNFISRGKTTFSLPFVVISTFAGSFFYNDLYYLLTDLYGVISQYDAVYYPITGVLTTAIHGIGMMVFPTSMMLVIGLKYFNVSIKDWFKTIWTYLIEAFVVVILVAIVVIILL